LPIREWDLAVDHQAHPLRVFGNRGANGIDGQLSTFLGWANGEATNWAVVGDLTALYDLSALWVTGQLPSAQWRIVIINNQGGQIFKRMFKKDIFLNAHQIQFQAWAQMWGWDYILTSSVDSLDKHHFSDRQIIEVHPDAEQTQQFWDQWEQAWV
jgi:2-succinyl-5-enolpyruvyl-6-hydroxy-3-cyclohexene-1-carboxylate synthase